MSSSSTEWEDEVGPNPNSATNPPTTSSAADPSTSSAAGPSTSYAAASSSSSTVSSSPVHNAEAWLRERSQRIVLPFGTVYQFEIDRRLAEAAEAERLNRLADEWLDEDLPIPSQIDRPPETTTSVSESEDDPVVAEREPDSDLDSLRSVSLRRQRRADRTMPSKPKKPRF